MDKIVVAPEDVRCLGNIVSEKGTSDFTKYLSKLTLSEGVYSLVYDNKNIVVTVSQNIVKTGSTITVTVTLSDEQGDPIEDASIELFKEV